MSMWYYDAIEGRERLKRRYVWAFWAFGLGLSAGLSVAVALIR